MAESPTFVAGLSERAVQRLGTLGRVRRYAAQQPLMLQGDSSDDLVILLDGWVKVGAASDTGAEIILAVRGPGDLIGEVAAIDGGPRSAAVWTLVAVEVRRIPSADFLAELSAEPELNRGLLRYLARKLRESVHKRLEYVSAPSFERLIRFLLDFAARHGEPQPGGAVLIARGLSQQELARAAAISLEMFNRGMRTLRERGLVRTTRRRTITIVRPDLLAAMLAEPGRGGRSKVS